MNETYQRIEQGNYWCNSHQRRAEYLCNGRVCCDPKLGGILLPCFTHEITKEIKVKRKSKKPTRKPKY